MRARIDATTRMVIELPTIVDAPVRDRDAPPAPFVELCVRTAFSGLTVPATVAAHRRAAGVPGKPGPGQRVVEGPTLAHAARAWPGAGLPDEVAERCAVYGYDAFAIADLDTLAGVVRAWTRAQELGLRLIVGCELWLDEGPLCLHAATADGYRNLCAILTRSKQDGAGAFLAEKDDVVHRLADVCARADGLYAIALPPFDERALGPLRDAFGERLSLGVYRHQVPEDEARVAWARREGERYGVPLVATARAFLVDRADKRLHDVLTCIRQTLRIDDAGQRLMPNAEALIRAPEEIAAIFHDLPDAVRRARAIADACRFELGQLKYAFPSDVDDPSARLRALTYEGARRRYPDGVPAEVAAQIERELVIIDEMEVAPYFLTVQEIVEIARERSILCQGRGSAANSAVCWCLGVTSIDPVRMGLLFERFLSKERGEPPDIDVDFEHERREEVIQEIYRRWGRDRAALVAEAISFRGRSAVREVGKVFGLTETVSSTIAGLMLHSGMAELPRDLSALGIDVDARQVERTLTYAKRLQGHPRHLGIHVGGFVLTREPIAVLAPVEPARMEDRTIIPWDKDDVDALGLFKMDVLGLGMLTCIRKAMDLTAAHHGVRYELHTIPAEQEDVYDALCRGDSIGVFQVESRAQMAMLPRLKPRTFYDLVVQVAIIRPGPIQGGMVHPYLRRRSGQEAVEMPHEILRPILERTLGVPLFQEQVMKLAIVGAGYSPGEADQLRRDMAAWKKNGRLERHRERLVRGFVHNGIPAEFADRLFEQIKGFGEYGFPESHAASFAILVYASAFLKTRFPACFAAALLNSQPMGFYSAAQIVADAQAHGVAVRAVDVNHSDWDNTIEGGALRLGLRQVKGLREDVGRAIAAERAARGAFVDVADASRRCALDQKATGALARAGAFDGVSVHRRGAVWNAMVKRPPLLRDVPDEDVRGALQAPSQVELLLLDYQHAGLSLDDHPMRYVRPRLQETLGRERLLTAAEVHAAPHGTRGTTAGLVVGRQRPGTADGTVFVTLEDETGLTNVVVWGRDFEKWRATVTTSAFLLFRGVIEKEGIVVHLIAKDVVGVRPDLVGDGAPQLDLPFRSRDFH